MQTLEGWLDELASSAPAPGGGAAGAVNAAIGAALISMVCNLTIGKPQFAETDDDLRSVLAQATKTRRACLDAADHDARSFDSVVAAYRMPKATADERVARTEAIQRALIVAAEVPIETAALAADVVRLADQIVDMVNPNVITDVSVAASSARAALAAAAVNVQVNVASINDTAQAGELARRLAAITDAASPLADRVVERVRERLT